MFKIEKNIWNWVENHRIIIFYVIFTLLSLGLRIYFYEYRSGDYEMFLEPWFNALNEGGGMAALSQKIGNYNASYMTILALLTYLPISPLISIKTVSVIFDYVCAIVVAKIVALLWKEKKGKKVAPLLAYSITLFLPTVVMNSACWAQADSIYTAFVLLSLLYLCKEKFVRAFVFLGIAFAFKLQFIFILPAYLWCYLSSKKFSILHFLWIVVMNFVIGLPSILCGNTLQNCWQVYVDQVNTYQQYITMNFPNFYGIFWGGTNEHIITIGNLMLKGGGILFTIVLLAIITYAILEKKVRIEKETMIDFGIWSILIVTFLLPGMHERYLYMGDILAVVYCLLHPKKYYLSLGIQLVSLYGYLYFLWSAFRIELHVASILYLIVVILYSKDMIERYWIGKKMQE